MSCNSCVCVCKIVAENESKTNFKWELTSLNRIVKKYFTSSFTFYLHSSLFFFLNRDFAFVYIPILLYLTCSNLAILSTTTATATERGKEKKVPYQFIDEISNLEARVMPTLHDFAT